MAYVNGLTPPPSNCIAAGSVLPTPIEAAASAQRSANQELGFAIETLAHKLAPILRSDIEVDKTGTLGMDVACPLEGNMRDEANSTSRSAAWIRDLTERLCL